jgi:putative hydrolase of the HAD superfamily
VEFAHVKALILDIYGTVLEVGPPRPDADAAWEESLRKDLNLALPPSRLEFSVATGRIIAAMHQIARMRGIPHPEVQWPSVVSRILPQIGEMCSAVREDFLYRLVQTGHTVRLKPQCAEVLAALASSGCLLGIASNAQSYTLRELAQLLSRAGLGMSIFDPDLCFWSYQHGFSKPDPHVWRILSARLEQKGVPPEQIMMVGDRLDNDIQPARRHGWQTWLLSDNPNGEHGGDWQALREAVQGEI